MKDFKLYFLFLQVFRAKRKTFTPEPIQYIRYVYINTVLNCILKLVQVLVHDLYTLYRLYRDLSSIKKIKIS